MGSREKGRERVRVLNCVWSLSEVFLRQRFRPLLHLGEKEDHSRECNILPIILEFNTRMNRLRSKQEHRRRPTN